MNRVNKNLILLFFFLVLSSFKSPVNYNFRNFNSEDGLAQSYIYSIIQDVHGYLWVGTGDGLSRYDGFKFENFGVSDSLADNFINCGINDGEGIWFGHTNGSLTYFNGKKFQSFHLTQLNLSPITHFAKSLDGRIWASTNSDGLIRLDKEKGVAKQYIFKDQTSIISFEFLDNNLLLIGTDAGLFYCRLKESGEIEIIRQIADILDSKITCIQQMKKQAGYYISTENDGIFQLNYTNKVITVSKINAGKDLNFSGIQYIYEDSQSNLWLASFGNGLVKLTYSAKGAFSNVEYFNKTNGFVTDNVKHIFEDREGNIWSGNYGEGLTQITPKTFSIYPYDRSLYGNDISSIYISQQYRWIGTEIGLLKIDQISGKMVKFYSTASGLPKDNITSIYSKDDLELWIGTENSGLFRLEVKKDRILKFPLGDGNLENSITCITGQGEHIWVGTKKGLCNINPNNNALNWYTINKGGLPHNYINCLYSDKTGRLWVSTRSNTLAYIQENKVFKIFINTVNGNIILGPIAEDSDSRIWIGSYGKGVFMIKPDSIANFTVKEGLLSNFCYSLIFDDEKNIWVGHKGGLSKIRTSDFLVSPIQQFEDLSDNYHFYSNTITKDYQGKIWFGTDMGIVCYNPLMQNSKLSAPILGITSIKINDIEKDYADKIILSPGSYNIKINYLGVSLKEPALVTYQYKLEGYDPESEITKNTNVTYNNLTEGEYTFILKAYSGDGNISEKPLIINIIIKKPIWKKWWFYLVSFLVISMLILFYIKGREYEFRAENRRLEENVIKRTFEIQNQKNEIELQRDLIGEKNANITSSIKYARHIQNAILTPLELINKLLPDNFILSKPKAIISGDFYWLAEKNNKIIFAVADCTGHGVPGAFMSILGITLLNEIVNILGITQSAQIVSMLRERIIHSFQQGRKDITTSDGMDISLCVLDKDQKKIQFTGAMNNLLYISDQKLNVVKADRLSVSLYGDLYPFTMNEFNYKAGDIFYLFSDGYQDQFGGIYNKKYLTRQFYNYLLEIHKFPMEKQKELLLNELKEWMGDSSQTDDVTVMGIRL